MIYQTRTIAIQAGKMSEAMEWAVKNASYVNDNYPSLNVQVLRNVSGKVYQVHWVASCDSLATLEEMTAKIEADPGYQESMAESAGLFVADTFVIRNYYTVP